MINGLTDRHGLCYDICTLFSLMQEKHVWIVPRVIGAPMTGSRMTKFSSRATSRTN